MLDRSTNTTTPAWEPAKRRPHRRHRSARRHFKDGYRAAAVRAFTAAGLVLSKRAPSVTAAALRCGSNVAYVRAALALLQAENKSLVGQVTCGKVPLLAAACEVRRLGKLVSAYRRATAADRVAFARAIGPTTLFDRSLVPAL